MGLEKGEQERSFSSGCGTKWINTLFSAQPAKRSHLFLYLRFVEGLVDAAASLETPSESPAAWEHCMRAHMYADGIISILGVT